MDFSKPKKPVQDHFKKQKDPLFVASMEKAIRVMEAFKHADQGDMSLSEIVAKTGLDKSAAQRFLHTWQTLGYLEKNLTTKRFRLTAKNLNLSYEYLRANKLIEIATPHMVEARNRTKHTFNLSVLDDIDIVYVVRVPNHLQVLKATLLGRRLTAVFTSGGRAILSRLPDGTVADIIERSPLVARTPFTITDPVKIMHEIEQARRKGYAIAAQESLIGEIAVAVPVVNASGEPIAALHIPTNINQWPHKRVVDQLVPIALETAHAISPQ